MRNASAPAAARKIAKLWPSLSSRQPRQTPYSPGSRKTSSLRKESPCPGHSDKQCRHGPQQASALAQSVPRETEPTANPAIHAQHMTRRSLERESPNVLSRAGSARRPATDPLAATDHPIRNRLAGSASPMDAAHGRQLFHKASCRRAARLRTSPSPRHTPRSVSARSQRTTSRSKGASNSAAASRQRQRIQPLLIWLFMRHPPAILCFGGLPTQFRC